MGNPPAARNSGPKIYIRASRHVNQKRPGHTLQTTALVNEAYLRLVDQEKMRWENRAHFFGIAVRLMREILVDHARSRQAAKRGGAIQGVAQ